MTSRSGRSCVRCQAPATVCPECVRAIALQWFAAVARHPEAGTDCRLCEQGHAAYCGHCFVSEVGGYRAVLLKTGTPIGEPASPWA
ncbi:MAG: hypothetical protein ACYC91_19850 [Solirubrobacteraceae bacterium]